MPPIFSAVMWDSMNSSPPAGPRATDLLRNAGSRLLFSIDRAITPERIRLYPLATLGVSMLVLTTMVLAGNFPNMAGGNGFAFPDYLAHWTAGRILLDGNASHLYDPSFQHLTQSREVGSGDLSWFISPPFMALVYAPFAMIGYAGGAIAWLILNVTCLFFAVKLMRPFAPRLFRHHFAVTAVALAASEPVFELLGTGQDTGISLLCWVGGIRLILAERERSAGVVFALGLLKPQLFILVPIVLIIRRRFTALAYWFLTATLLAGISVGIVGVDGVINWLKVPSTDFYANLVQTTQAWKLEGLPTLVKFLFPPQLRTLGTMLSLLTVAGSIFVFVRHTIRADRRDSPELGVWMLAMLATCVASPHLFIYDLVIALVPVLYLVEHHNTRRVRVATLAAFALTWSLSGRFALVQDAPWPLSTFAAAWTAVPLVVLWACLATDLDRQDASQFRDHETSGLENA